MSKPLLWKVSWHGALWYNWLYKWLPWSKITLRVSCKHIALNFRTLDHLKQMINMWETWYQISRLSLTVAVITSGFLNTFSCTPHLTVKIDWLWNPMLANVTRQTRTSCCCADKTQRWNSYNLLIGLQVQRLYERYLRAESFRKALVYQKRYLLLLLGGFQECEQATLCLIAHMGARPSPPLSSQRRPLGRFRAAVRVVIAVSR